MDSCRKVLTASTAETKSGQQASSQQQQQTTDEQSYRQALSKYESTSKTAFTMALPGLLTEMRDIEAKRVFAMTSSITHGLELLQVSVARQLEMSKKWRKRDEGEKGT